MPREMNDKYRIQRMLEIIRQVESYAYYRYFEDFSIDNTEVLAMLKRLEIVGEAAHWISPVLKEQHRDIDWEDVASLRHSLVDEYHEYNPKTIWRVMTRQMPLLKNRLEKILPTLPDAPGQETTE